jgi:pyruvate/2-oxoglutarate dehydrogenase complex dihydrolipoamide acyltransferase (E2) component
MRLESVHLPDLGTGPDQIIRVSHWYARPGRMVCEGDRLVEVVVGAAVVNVPAPASGRLHAIEREEDDEVEPHGVLGILEVPDADSALAF